MSDREIMEIYRSGAQEQAFNLIVKKYGERLYWHIRRFTCSHEDTDDLLQETFTKIWTALPSFREDARLFTWIYRIATNESLNYLRKRKAMTLFSSGSIIEDMEKRIDSDPYFSGNELQRILMKSIQKLPDKQKTVFTMRYFDELSYDEISEITGNSVGSLKVSYHLAYKKIKSAIENVL